MNEIPRRLRVYLKKRALKGLNDLEHDLREKVLEMLDVLEENPIPRSLDLRKLRGYEDTFRIRIGRIRIVYSIDWESGRIMVHFIGPRERAYRGT